MQSALVGMNGDQPENLVRSLRGTRSASRHAARHHADLMLPVSEHATAPPQF